MRSRTIEVATHVLDSVRPWVLDEGCSPATCILMTRIVVDMLGRIGVKAEPVACIATVTNRPVTEYLRAHDYEWPKTRMDRILLRAMGGLVCQVGGTTEEAAAKVGAKDAVHFGPGSVGYAAHVMALTEDDVLIDSSLDQVNYMVQRYNAKNDVPIELAVPNIVLELEGEKVEPGVKFSVDVGENDEMVTYEFIESPQPWDELDDWVITDDEREAWTKLIDQFMTELEE